MRLLEVTLPDHRHLAVTEWGDPNGKPVFVFITASCPDDESIPQREGLRLFKVDRPGMGASDWLVGRTLRSFAADIAYAADQLGCPRFGIIGVSHSGATAVTCAVHFPDRVAALGLVSSIAPLEFFSPPEPLIVRLSIRAALHAPYLLYAGLSLARVIIQMNAQWFIRQTLRSMSKIDQSLFAGQPQLLTLQAQGLRNDFRQGVRGVMREGQLGYLPWDIQPDTIRTPTLIWHGEQDTAISPDTARWWASQLPESRLNMIPNAGHLLVFSHWDVILTEFAAMLS